ncbi:MAG TPA: acyl-CoA carboxylase subunit epsilon [Acidimicrobiia bacterium]|nr:acyl-CoA carboxylase subunit epsilon [Acidimicrobiia bacterium]
MTTHDNSSRPVLRVVSPSATPDEVAAIVAAVGSLTQPVAVVDTSGPDDPDRLDAWVHVSRLSSRRASLQRGSWRLYGRLGRRRRA